MQIRHNYTETLESTCDTFSKGGFYRLTEKNKLIHDKGEGRSGEVSATKHIK